MLEVQETQAGQAVTELLGNVQIIVIQLEVAVFFNAADIEFMLQ